jgi:glycosyltransferase involved in cell wall biosynthesis
MFLDRTIQDILENIEGNTEIIAILDGEWPKMDMRKDKRVTYIFHNEAKGQRVSTNEAVRMSKSKYILKCDAHCAFDKGFDVKMMNLMQDDYTMIPVMRNLHAFDWVCKNGHRRYQGISGVCKECGEPTEMDVVWIAKTNPQSTAYRFDKTMHFQYWNEFGKQQKGDLTETLSIQGSCFMLTREKYWELDICSEDFHSWGQQGVEVACKTWLSGGKVVVNRTTWYAHMFRTAGGDFSFPYEQPQSKVNENRELSRKLFQHDGWDKAKLKFQWLLDKFNPPEWKSKKSGLTKGILYYTDNQLNIKLAKKCRRSMSESGLPITSVSLKPLTDFGHNIHFKGERSVLTMHKQILTGLKAMTEDIIFFCEHDCLYHKSHFDFVPEKKDVFYYNENNWRVRLDDGHAVYFAHDSLSQMCAYRELLIKEFEERVKRIEEKGFNHGGFEPGTRTLAKGGFSDNTSARWRSAEPNIDIRHSNNLTPSRWSVKDFRDKNTCKDWTEGNLESLWARPILKEFINKE